MHVNKFMGYSVDMNKTSVKEFYTYLEGLKEEAKQRSSNEW